MVDPQHETDPYELAMKELTQNKVPFIVRRYLPDGSYEDWKACELKTLEVWIRLIKSLKENSFDIKIFYHKLFHQSFL